MATSKSSDTEKKTAKTSSTKKATGKAASTVKKTASSTKTTAKKAASGTKTTAKKTTTTKKVTTPKKSSEEKKIETKVVEKEPVKKKSAKMDQSIKKELVELEVRELSFGYMFLLCSLVIFLCSVWDFNFMFMGVSISYAALGVPFLFLLVDVILKEVGYKHGIKALVISTLLLFVYSMLIDSIFGVEFDILKYSGFALAYLAAQFINLSIYYYMLDNYETPFILVIGNFIFSHMIFNFLDMSFRMNLVYDNTFFKTYAVVLLIQFVITILCTFILSLVKQGVEV